MFQSFLKGLGKAFAAIGSGALQGALFVSAHPEVVQAVANVAVQFGAPAAKTTAIATDVALGAVTTSAVKGSVDAAKAGDVNSAVADALGAAQAAAATTQAIKSTK